MASASETFLLPLLLVNIAHVLSAIGHSYENVILEAVCCGHRSFSFIIIHCSNNTEIMQHTLILQTDRQTAGQLGSKAAITDAHVVQLYKNT